VVAAQNQRRTAGIQGGKNGVCGARARLRNLAQVMRIPPARRARLRHFHANVPAVYNVVTQRLEPRLQAGDAHRRGPHVHAAAARPHIQRNADNANVAGGLRLRAARWHAKNLPRGIDALSHATILLCAPSVKPMQLANCCKKKTSCTWRGGIVTCFGEYDFRRITPKGTVSQTVLRVR
jgi:hypothetical protein